MSKLSVAWLVVGIVGWLLVGSAGCVLVYWDDPWFWVVHLSALLLALLALLVHLANLIVIAVSLVRGCAMATSRDKWCISGAALLSLAYLIPCLFLILLMFLPALVAWVTGM